LRPGRLKTQAGGQQAQDQFGMAEFVFHGCECPIQWPYDDLFP
jgi:hypothetical protein